MVSGEWEAHRTVSLFTDQRLLVIEYRFTRAKCFCAAERIMEEEPAMQTKKTMVRKRPTHH